MLLLSLLLWQSSFDLGRIEIHGLSRFSSKAVETTIGLKPGARAGKPEFDAACRRLMETGLFNGCNWKYVPSSPTEVTLVLDLQEAPAEQTVRLTVPGVSEPDLWEWLRTNEPLIQPKIPSSDEANAFYVRAVQRFLKQELAPSIETNLQTKETVLVFRPANAPKFASVQFNGTEAITSGALEKAIGDALKGTPATEYDLVRLLDLYIKPLYEELGRLDVAFRSIKAENGAVTVNVDEGKVYRLGEVRITGTDRQPELQKGAVANWRRITDALDSISRTLRNQGYLDAGYQVARKLEPESATVDLDAAYKQGIQYKLGALKLDGLSAAQEANVRKLWRIPVGSPMNEGYVEEFIRAAFEKLGPEYSGVATQMEPQTGNVVDVSITFRRQ